MPDNALANVVEIFSAPIEGVIVSLGQAIATAQRELDRSSINTQETLDTDPALSPYGLQATWYQFPRVDLQLKIAMSITQEQPSPQAAPIAAAAPGARLAAVGALHLVAQPVSAAFQNHFNYDAQAASVITLSIVPVPPQRAADQATIAPHLSPEAVQSAALASAAKFTTTKDAQGNTIPVANLRFDVNFNAAARLWYVLQYDPANPTATPVVVAVDDATGSVRVISSP